MKKEDLFEILGKVDEEELLKTEIPIIKTKKRNRIMGYVAIAASLMIVLSIKFLDFNDSKTMVASNNESGDSSMQSSLYSAEEKNSVQSIGESSSLDPVFLENLKIYNNITGVSDNDLSEKHLNISEKDLSNITVLPVYFNNLISDKNIVAFTENDPADKLIEFTNRLKFKKTDDFSKVTKDEILKFRPELKNKEILQSALKYENEDLTAISYVDGTFDIYFKNETFPDEMLLDSLVGSEKYIEFISSKYRKYIPKDSELYKITAFEDGLSVTKIFSYSKKADPDISYEFFSLYNDNVQNLLNYSFDYNEFIVEDTKIKAIKNHNLKNYIEIVSEYPIISLDNARTVLKDKHSISDAKFAGIVYNTDLRSTYFVPQYRFLSENAEHGYDIIYIPAILEHYYVTDK